MQTHVFIPAQVDLEDYSTLHGRFNAKHECTIIAFVGVGTSHSDGSYNSDVMAVAMLPTGRVVTKRAHEFTILPAADLEPAEVL